MKKKTAFTLIELLTVIAIIGILASILIPVVGVVRDNARRSLCLSNLRQIGMATVTYASENDGQLPYSNWGTPAGVQGWLFDTSMHAPVRRPVNPVTRGALWPYLNTPTVYQCPTDWMQANSDLFKSRVQELSSYVMNGSVTGYSEGDPFRIEQFESNAIIFWEADERFPHYYNDGANFPNEGISTRHGTGANIAGIDGHVEVISVAEWERQIEMRPGRFWNNPASPTGD